MSLMKFVWEKNQAFKTLHRESNLMDIQFNAHCRNIRRESQLSIHRTKGSKTHQLWPELNSSSHGHVWRHNLSAYGLPPATTIPSYISPSAVHKSYTPSSRLAAAHNQPLGGTGRHMPLDLKGPTIPKLLYKTSRNEYKNSTDYDI